MSDATHQQLLDLQNQMRQLGLRPQGALASFLQRARINGAAKTVDAALNYVQATNALNNALADNQQSKDNLARATAAGTRIHKTIAADEAQANANLLEAQEREREAAHKAQLRAWERERELQQARPQSASRDAAPSQASQEFRADFDMAATAARARTETEDIIADYLKRHGDTPETRAAADDIRQRFERLVRESGL